MYRKVASSNTSYLEAHAGFFRLLMKGIFDAFGKKYISELVMRVSICPIQLHLRILWGSGSKKKEIVHKRCTKTRSILT
jgi:cadmium resistance protein CadD (predicted permease)